MQPRVLEGAFERFRSAGDVAALGEVFDRAAPELLELACHLRSTTVEAEDLVQSTFVAAIENARRWNGAERLMPWLAGILIRQAARARRDARRAPDPARLAERVACDPAAASDAVEVRETLREALERVPNPYRDVLARHLVDGRRAVDIARDLSRAPGTVRMQILRGLDLLRRALPPSFASALALGVAPRGHAELREAVLLHARASLVGSSASALSVPALMGASIMSMKVAVTCASALVLAAALWFAARAQSPAARPEPSGARADGALVAAREPNLAEPTFDRDARTEATEGHDAAPAGEAPRAPRTGLWLRGTVRGFDPELASGLSIYCNACATQYLRGPIGADGTFDVELTQFVAEPDGPCELLLAVNQPTYFSENTMLVIDSASIERSATEEVVFVRDFELTRASGVDGRVVVPADWRMQEVQVFLFALDESGATKGEALRAVEPEPDGGFGFRMREPGRYRVMAWSSGLAPASADVVFAPAQVERLPDLVLDLGSIKICGTLHLPADIERAGVRLEANEVSVPLATERREDQLRMNEQSGRSDAEGRFCIGGLLPGRYSLVIVDAPNVEGILPTAALEVDAPSEGVEIGQALGRVVVIARSAEGPLAGARVDLVNGEEHYVLRTNEGGRCTVLADIGVDYDVRVSKAGFSSEQRALDALGRGPDIALEVVLLPLAASDARLVLEPVFGAGQRATRARIRMKPLDESPLGERESTVELVEGAFTVADVHPGRYEVAVEPWENSLGPYYVSYLYCERFTAELAAGRELRRELRFVSGGRFRVTVTGFEGGENVQTCSLVDSAQTAFDVRYVTRKYRDDILTIGEVAGEIPLEGTSEAFPNLAPGTYALRLAVRGYRTLDESIAIRAGETTEVALHLVRE